MSAREVWYVSEFLIMFLVWGAVGLTYQVMTRGRWRRSPEGRHVMVLALLFTWLSLLISANILFGDYPGRSVIGVISYGLPIPYGLQRLVMIVRAQRRKRSAINHILNQRSQVRSSSAERTD